MNVHNFKKIKPKSGQLVIWIWSAAGLVFDGDYYRKQVRCAHENFKPSKGLPPDKWMDADEFWKVLEFDR